ncbi:MAG TPA: transporter substrate-binding domain-containing protein [Anaerolineales bacterium]|nr:transporter substrate-binding domain-containing protein [Anaerolineales bacterium]HRF48178.1 transporter substrate-binding domain-containing protein [Anaerolineales bacterium]
MKTSSRSMRILTGLLTLVLAAGCGGAPTPDGATEGGEAAGAPTNILDQIVAAGTIKIAIPEDTPLFGTLAADGSYEGYDVDIANMLAADMGVKAELVAVSSQNRIPYLTSGKVDLVISSMGIKPERALVINFSNAYAPFFWAVYGSADKPVTNVEEAKAYTIGATLGTLEEIAFSDAAGPDANIMRFDDQATTVQAFVSGQVDLIVTGNSIAGQIIKDHPEMNVESKFVLQQSPCHIGVRRGDEALLTWVNAFIYSHMLNHDLDNLSLKWFGEPLPDFPNF